MGNAARSMYQPERARMDNREIEMLSTTDAGLARFENWRAWATNGERAMLMQHFFPSRVSACKFYKSREHYLDDEDPRPEIDKDDAAVVDAALSLLPRQLKTAVTNRYLGRPEILNVPYSVLDEWVCQAARELMARWP